MSQPGTMKIFGMDLPVLCWLSDGWNLVAHPNGIALAIRYAQGGESLGSLAHPPEEFTEAARTKAIEWLEREAWRALKPRYYPDGAAS